MSLLDKHQKSDIRYQSGDLILYEPSQDKYNKIKNIVEENLKIENNEISGELALSFIRLFIKELTNIGNEIDDIHDIELAEKLNNGDRELQNLLRAIEELINEIVDDIVYEQINELKKIKAFIKSLESKKDLKDFEDVINGLFKANGYDVTYSEIANIDYNNPECVDEMIKKLQKTKK